MLVDSVYSHIKSERHRISTPDGETDLLEGLKQKIDKLSYKPPKQKQTPEEKKENDKKGFLEFIAFMVKERLSYSQIQRIGDFLKEIYKENGLSFLKNSSFDRGLVSLIEGLLWI